MERSALKYRGRIITSPLRVGTFSFQDGAQIQASTAGTGNAGNIKIGVTGAADISGTRTAISSAVRPTGRGNGGNMTIEAGSVSIRDAAQVSASTFGLGNVGNGGTIDLNATKLSLANGGQIQAGTRRAADDLPAGRGDAGNINVKVSGAVDISGTKNGFSSGIFSLIDIGTIGTGGDITIEADSASLSPIPPIASIPTVRPKRSAIIHLQLSDAAGFRLAPKIPRSMDAQPGACSTPYALSTMLAYAYLQDRPQPIELKIEPNSLQIGAKHFNFLTAHTGGYQQFDDRGYQIPLNYRSTGSLTDAIPSISFQKIFTLPDRELKQLIEHKIVLIGTTDSRYKDISKTPYAAAARDSSQCREHEGYQCIPGVFLQAQMTSQLVNAALKNRPLFWAAPFWVDSSIVLLCSTIGGLLVWAIRERHWLVLGLGSGI